jgi:hypothetical protein
MPGDERGAMDRGTGAGGVDLAVDADFESRATAAVLRSGAPVAVASFGMTFLALAEVALAAHLSAPVRFLVAAALVLGLVESWYALRVAIDARLFALTGLASHLAALDRVLARLRGSTSPPGRGLDDRSRAALGLWKRQVAAALLQAGCLVAAAIEYLVVG